MGNKIHISYFIASLCIVLGVFGIAAISHACTIAAPTVVIEGDVDATLFTAGDGCLDADCTYAVWDDPLPGDNWYLVDTRLDNNDDTYRVARVNIQNEDKIVFQYYYDEANTIATRLQDDALIRALDRLLVADITDAAGTIQEQATAWENERWPGDLRIVRYSTELERYGVDQRNDLRDCQYSAMTRSGDWLILHSENRDYCYQSDPWGALCGGPLVISYPQYIDYLLTNYPSRAIPYLAGAALVAVLIIAGMVYLTVRKQWRAFIGSWRTAISFGITSGVVYALLEFVGIPRALPTAIVVLILLYIMRYLVVRRKQHPATS